MYVHTYAHMYIVNIWVYVDICAYMYVWAETYPARWVKELYVLWLWMHVYIYIYIYIYIYMSLHTRIYTHVWEVFLANLIWVVNIWKRKVWRVPDIHVGFWKLAVGFLFKREAVKNGRRWTRKTSVVSSSTLSRE